ncbi:MAG TPA: porin, partial [Sphingomonas sp.]|nr:porin [Sphingomonas sp.]
MRIALIAGVSCAALAAAPAFAQEQSNAALQARLDALEARVGTLERRNAALERQLAASRAAPAPASAPNAVAQAAPPPSPASSPPPAESAQWTIVPKFTSPDGAFSFKPRGALDVDYAAFHERRGGYAYNNGTEIRRGRFGFDGTAFRRFAWRIEGEWVDNKANLLDAYVAYTGIRHATITLGQLKVPAGLEANTSDSFNEFIERGMANTAFGAVGGERRVGLTLAYADKLITATGGLYGAGEAVDRNPATPGEVWGLNGRVTLEPVNRPGRLVHLGASAWRVKDLADNSVTLGDRPNIRVDGGYLERIAITGSNPQGGPEAGVKTAIFYGLEGAGVLGPFSVQGEYSHLYLDRFADAPSLNLDGWYA